MVSESYVYPRKYIFIERREYLKFFFFVSHISIIYYSCSKPFKLLAEKPLKSHRQVCQTGLKNNSNYFFPWIILVLFGSKLGFVWSDKYCDVQVENAQSVHLSLFFFFTFFNFQKNHYFSSMFPRKYRGLFCQLCCSRLSQSGRREFV